MGKTKCLHFFLAVFNRILVILADNEDKNKSLDEFEFSQDQNTDYGVGALVRLKNDVSIFSQLLLIRSILVL